MNKKGRLLVSIILIKFILSTLLIYLFPDYSYISSFLLGFIVPIIFITQLNHRRFYRYFGFFLLVQVFISLLLHFVSESNSYTIVLSISYLVSFGGYIAFLLYSLKLEDMKKTTLYMIILILNILYINHTVLDYLPRLNLSALLELFLRVVVPLALSWMALLFQILIILYECEVQDECEFQVNRDLF